MPINWEDADKQIDEAVEAAAKRTNDKLAGTISSLTSLTDAEVKRLFPTPADLKQLSTLMQIVKSAESRNRKLNTLASNIEDVAGAVITLLDRLA